MKKRKKKKYFLGGMVGSYSARKGCVLHVPRGEVVLYVVDNLGATRGSRMHVGDDASRWSQRGVAERAIIC